MKQKFLADVLRLASSSPQLPFVNGQQTPSIEAKPLDVIRATAGTVKGSKAAELDTTGDTV